VVKPAEVTWELSAAALKAVAPIRKQLGDNGYEKDKQALRTTLCEYFSSSTDCVSKGLNISPIGKTPRSGKVLKARWAFPGCGKSGGLRLCVVAYCGDKRVRVASAVRRKDEPTTKELMISALDAEKASKFPPPKPKA
jgi:hypothetical protein